jgi:transglutaminase-like putative cysteine protease
MSPAPTWRLLGLLGLATVVVGAGPLLGRRGWRLAAPASILAIVGMLAIAGVPLGWLWHIRIAVSGRAIGQGLSALPGLLLPYVGINEWVRLVILLGAGILLLDAAILLAFAPPALGDARRAGAALPLVVLAIVPTTLIRPQLPYLQGLILFGLLAAFMWGERAAAQSIAAGLALVALAGSAAILAAPALDQHRPWLNYQALAGTLAPTHIETFDWSQRYGPLHWPRTGSEVLEVKAARPEYWKAQNLDLFDGRGWAVGTVTQPVSADGIDQRAMARWTQTLQVTFVGMKTTEVIAAGSAQAPAHIPGPVFAGPSLGTWSTTTTLGPGDSYLISTYSPEPSARELASAGTQYPSQLLPGYLEMTLPAFARRSAQGTVISPPQQVFFTPFDARRAAVYGQARIDPAAAALAGSPYEPAFALSRRLAAHAATPYAYVLSVERYLSRGFGYNERPPVRPYPLESFLFEDRIGYCQQFAGAMALLLRMGGIPARVSAGFTSGTYDDATHSWVVSDVDAHAWVEAWFPHYGWVQFDPTPAIAPARGGRVPIPATKSLGGTAGQAQSLGGNAASATPAGAGGHPRGAPKSSPALVVALVVALALAIGIAGLLWRRGEPSVDRLVAELERALARARRPLEGGATLAALEDRLRSSPQAAAYVRAIRLSRFSPLPEHPTREQRRALRAYLRSGLGVTGRLRALWALPPYWSIEKTGFARLSLRIH